MNAIMNVKGRQTKLLAAIAVFAMVACVFAVVMPSDEAQGAYADNSVTLDDGVTLMLPGDLTGTASGTITNSTIVIKGTAPVAYNADECEGSTFLNVMNTNNAGVYGYAFAQINGLGKYLSDASATYTIKQTNPALSVYNDKDAGINGTEKSATYTSADVANGYAFLIPKENTGNTVTIEISNATDTVAKFTLDFSAVTTEYIVDDESELQAAMDQLKSATSKTNVTISSNLSITKDIEIPENANVIVKENNTLTIGAKVTGSGSIENNGTINFTGTGTAVVGLFSAYDGINAFFYGGVFGTLTAITPISGAFTNTLSVFGSVSGDIKIADNTGKLSLGGYSSYTGTITYVDNGITYAINLVASSGNGVADVITYNSGVSINGSGVGLGDYIVSSSVIVNSIVASGTDLTNANVNLSGVQLGNAATFNVITKLTLTGNVAVPENSAISMGDGGSIVINDTYNLALLGSIRYNTENYANTISGAGDIYTDFKSKVSPYLAPKTGTGATFTGEVFEIRNQSTTVTTADQFLSAVNNNLNFTLGKNVLILDDITYSNGTITTYTGASEPFTNFAIQIGLTQTDLDAIEAGTFNIDTAYPDSEWIIIGEKTSQRGSLSLTGATIMSSHDGQKGITVGERSTLTINTSKVFATVETGKLSTVNSINNSASYTNTASQVIVGYGTDFTLIGDATVDVFVYGHLTIGSDVVVGDDNNLRVFKGGNLTVSSEGSIVISGNAVFEGGSTTVVDGTFTVDNRNGLSSVTVGTSALGADFTISETGTMNINASGSGIATYNTLIIENSPAEYNVTDKKWDSRFLVEGTLNVAGAVSGEIHDNGTVTITGVVDGTATVVLYDGVTLNGLSVSSGSLIVTDKYVATSVSGGRVNTQATDGNSIMLQNVSGISISETVESFTYKIGNTNYTGYQSIMAISGNIASTANGTVDITNNRIVALGDDDKTDAYVVITDSVVLGQNTTLTVGENIELVVDGSLTATAAKGTDGKTTDSKIINQGVVTVNGTMTVLKSGNTSFYTVSGGTTNAVMRETTTTANGATVTNQIYSGFSAAIDAGLDADRDTVTVMGTVYANESKTIPAGLNIDLADKANLVIGDDAEVILTATAKMDGMTATVTVNGTFTAQDWQDDLSVQKVSADVMIDNTPARTWTSLANALADAQPGTTITLNQAIIIKEDTVIPEGVTVTTNVAPSNDGEDVITIDDCTLTVEGTLQMGTASEGAIGTIDDGNVVVGQTGVFSAVADAEPEAVSNVDGAHFAMFSGASTTYYVSNLAFAATTTANSEYVDGNIIKIVGSVSGADVTFAGGSNVLKIQIVVKNIIDSEGNPGTEMSILSTGTITLDNAMLVSDQNTQFTGTVTGAGATVTMARAEGFTIQEYDDASQETQYLYLYGNIDGAYNVTAGTVTVDKVGSTASDEAEFSVADTGEFTIAAGATLWIAANGVIDNASENFAVDGTLTVRNADGITGTEAVVVNGTMNVRNFTLSNEIRIVGTLAVEDGNYTLTVSNGGRLFLGAAPGELGELTAATLSGTVNMSGTGYIVAYAGADISGAQINWNSVLGSTQAQTTTYHINDTEFATVYAFGTVYINSVFGATAEVIDLAGWETGNIVWKDADNANISGTAAIGSPENVYTTVSPSTVKGVATVGAGVNLYIDGIQVYEYGTNIDFSSNITLGVGTHKVSYEIKAGWDGSSVVLSFNGTAIENDSTFTITADMDSFTISATGAINSTGTSDNTSSTSGDDGLGLTDYLLIVLVVLIVVMAIIVAIRLMRS